MQQEEVKLIEMQRHSQELENTFRQVQHRAEVRGQQHQHRDLQEMMRRMEDMMTRLDEFCIRMPGRDPCSRDRDQDNGQPGMTEEAQAVRVSTVAQQQQQQQQQRQQEEFGWAQRVEELSTRLGTATETTRRLEGEKR